MSTTPHPIAPEEIMAHLDGELSAAGTPSVSAHIETCASCQELVSSLGHTSRSLTDWTVGSVPASLKNSVTLSSANSRSQSGSAGPHWFPGTLRLSRKQWMGGLAAAAAAAVLLLSISVPRMDRAKLAGPRAGAFARLPEQQAAAVKGQPVDYARVNSAEEQQEGDRISSAGKPRTWSSAQAPSGSPQAGYENKAWHAPTAKNPSSGLTVSAPMIARTVSLSLIAKDFDASRASLDSILARHNGYSANLAVNTPQGAARTLEASLRIPAPQLPAALIEIKALGRAEAESQNGEEVTQQHADLLARLKNSRETEQRLQAILTERTGKISDVLEVEQEIARVRGEIEQMEAEQKNLEHRVDFATINLQLSEEYKAKLDSPAPAISTLIHNAAVNGYRNVADTLLAIILFFAEYLPVLVFWLLVLSIPAWLVWRRWRHAVAI
jgi:hypothetical protein